MPKPPEPAPQSREPNIDDPELLEDGQEEVFSRTAIEHGMAKDPKALAIGEEGDEP